MYNGNEKKRVNAAFANKSNVRLYVTFLSLVLALTLAIGGTVAYLVTKDQPITNKFTASTVDCEVTEDFDGVEKTNVNVENTGDTDAYVRVKLVTYRVNENGQHIGGLAQIPEFTPGTNWVLHDGYYYYTLPIAAGESADTDLIEKITLTGSYDDADGGKQVIEVMAEAVQSEPGSAVADAWGVKISEGSVVKAD